MSQNEQTMSPEEIAKKQKQWTQTEFTRAMQHLVNLGVQTPQVMQTESRVLPPLVALWRAHGKMDGKMLEVWVVTGQDIPVDHIPFSAAPNAREAMRHFFMSFQLKSARLEQGLKENRVELGNAELQRQYIQSLVIAAERLNALVNTEQLWPEFKNA